MISIIHMQPIFLSESYIFEIQNWEHVDVTFFLGLGRAKARPEIWPASHAFWVARPNPGHIFEGP